MSTACTTEGNLSFPRSPTTLNNRIPHHDSEIHAKGDTQYRPLLSRHQMAQGPQQPHCLTISRRSSLYLHDHQWPDNLRSDRIPPPKPHRRQPVRKQACPQGLGRGSNLQSFFSVFSESLRGMADRNGHETARNAPSLGHGVRNFKLRCRISACNFCLRNSFRLSSSESLQ